MKKTYLWIILILLIIIICLLTWIKFFDNGNIVYNKQKSSNNEMEYEITYWKSYKRETFNENNVIEDYSDNSNYIIEVDKDRIAICTFEPNNCDLFSYEKKGARYVIGTDNQKVVDANFEIKDANGEIQIIKRYEDGYSIFYFKKVSE